MNHYRSAEGSDGWGSAANGVRGSKKRRNSLAKMRLNPRLRKNFPLMAYGYMNHQIQRYMNQVYESMPRYMNHQIQTFHTDNNRPPNVCVIL